MVTHGDDRTSADGVAIITGGSRGVGRAVTSVLASRGYSVVVNYFHNQLAADGTVDAILAADGNALAVRADVADGLDVERLFAETIEAFGTVDVVVHAARLVFDPSTAGVGLESFDELCRTNVRGTFVVNRQAARDVRDGGAIVNLTRPVVGSTWPTQVADAAGKAAVEAITRVLAHELRARDVTVNVVALGLAGASDAQKIADIVAFLVSGDGHGLSGQLIRVEDGPSDANCDRRPRPRRRSTSARTEPGTLRARRRPRCAPVVPRAACGDKRVRHAVPLRPAAGPFQGPLDPDQETRGQHASGWANFVASGDPSA